MSVAGWRRAITHPLAFQLLNSPFRPSMTFDQPDSPAAGSVALIRSVPSSQPFRPHVPLVMLNRSCAWSKKGRGGPPNWYTSYLHHTAATASLAGIVVIIITVDTMERPLARRAPAQRRRKAQHPAGGAAADEDGDHEVQREAAVLDEGAGAAAHGMSCRGVESCGGRDSSCGRGGGDVTGDGGGDGLAYAGSRVRIHRAQPPR